MCVRDASLSCSLLRGMSGLCCEAQCIFKSRMRGQRLLERHCLFLATIQQLTRATFHDGTLAAVQQSAACSRKPRVSRRFGLPLKTGPFLNWDLLSNSGTCWRLQAVYRAAVASLAGLEVDSLRQSPSKPWQVWADDPVEQRKVAALQKLQTPEH